MFSAKHLRQLENFDKILDMEPNELNSRIDQVIETLQKLKAEVSATAPVLPIEAQRLLEAGICLVCKEKIDPNERSVRGCHERHARRVAEHEAITQGIIAPQATAGRKKVSILDEVAKFSRESKALADIKAAEAKLKRKRSKQ